MSTLYDPETFRDAAARTVEHLAEHLSRAQSREIPVLPWTPPEEQVAHWAKLLRERHDPAELLREVIDRSHHLQHPRYMGHQVSVPLPVGALADLVTSILNNGMAVYEMAPVGLAVERACVRWMCDTLGYPVGADGVFTSGGSLGNLTALLAARQAAADWDVWTEGAHAGPPLCVLVSEQSHYCIARAASIMGLGTGGVVLIDTDDDYRVTPETVERALERARDAGRTPFALVASSCTTSTGTYDPIPEMADIAAAHQLWLHVDGAHGASAAVSPAHRHRLRGIERADSVVWDAHKLLGVPSLSTAVLFRESRRSYEAFAQDASYLFSGAPEEHWWDGGHRTLECTRRMLSLPLFLVLAAYGEDALAAHVETLCGLAARFAQIVRDEPGFSLAMEPESNIVCFRYEPEGAGDLDALQDEIRDAILQSGRFYIVRTALRTGVHLRVTLMNPLTRESDLRELLEEVRQAASASRPV